MHNTSIELELWTVTSTDCSLVGSKIKIHVFKFCQNNKKTNTQRTPFLQGFFLLNCWNWPISSENKNCLKVVDVFRMFAYCLPLKKNMALEKAWTLFCLTMLCAKFGWSCNSRGVKQIFKGRSRPRMFLFVCLWFFVPFEIFSLIWKRHHCRWRAANFDLY